jgi:methionyl-tRNA formyltransferase
MRLAFLGTPEPAVASLRALVEAGHEIVLVITRPDKRRGRGSELSPSPVKAAALELGLHVEHKLAALGDVNVDLAVVVAYGRIIPVDLLERCPMVNVHFSLLPRWRGAAPVERAVLAGDEETGVCIMALDEELDTGAIYAQAATPIGDKTTGDLLEELAGRGSRLLVEVLAGGLPLPTPTPQVGEVTYAEKMEKADFFLSPQEDVSYFARLVRTQRAVATFNAKRCKVHATGERRSRHGDHGSVHISDGRLWWSALDGDIEVTQLQLEGAKSLSAAAVMTGLRGSESLRWDRPSVES